EPSQAYDFIANPKPDTTCGGMRGLPAAVLTLARRALQVRVGRWKRSHDLPPNGASTPATSMDTGVAAKSIGTRSAPSSKSLLVTGSRAAGCLLRSCFALVVVVPLRFMTPSRWL